MSDQGESYLAWGCTQCGVWQGDKRIRPAFIVTERRGHRYWTCPMCEGNYAEVESAPTPTKAESEQMAALLEEASRVICGMTEAEFERLQVRHYLCDELEGSAIMLRDALPPSLPAAQQAEPLTPTPRQYLDAHLYLREREADLGVGELDHLLSIFGIGPATQEKQHG